MYDEEEHDAANRAVEAPEGESEEDASEQGEQELALYDEEEEDNEDNDGDSAAPSSEAGDNGDGVDEDADDSDDDYSVRLYGAVRRAAEAAPRRSATLVRVEALQRRQEEQQHERLPPQPHHEQQPFRETQHLRQQLLPMSWVREQLLLDIRSIHVGDRSHPVRLIRHALGVGVQRRLAEGGGGGPPRSGVVRIDSESIEHAVDDLEHPLEDDEIEHLVVSTNVPREEWTHDVVAHHPECFRRLVELLGDPGRILRSIKFETVDFDRDYGIRAADLDRLFGATLPLHPTLRKIEFDRCYISPRYFAMFTASLSSNATPATTDESPRATIIPTKELVFEGGLQQGFMIAADRLRSIAGMVGRTARVHGLTLTSGWQGFPPSMFQVLCSGLRHGNNNNNTSHLRSLTVELSYVPEDALRLALGPASPLEVLRITKGAPARGVPATLARLLEGNATLRELALAERVGNDGDPHRLDDIVSVLEISNFTLHKFSEGTASDSTEHRGGPCHHHLVQASRIGACLRRNMWIHRVLRDWPNYRVPSQGLWPAVLHKADHCPTLLYRFLRIGNLPAFCERVVSRSRRGGRKRKERSP
jgi:hypothetical protein